MRRLLIALTVALLGACESTRHPPVSGCDAVDSLVPVCGFQQPEDIELLPDGRTLLISQMGEADGSYAGSLALYDTASGTITRLPSSVPSASAHWGSDACTEAPGAAFSPHGIDLLRRSDGALELFAVNHGGRESVELFEVQQAGSAWSLEWRGCVLPPENTYLNDVAALPDGSIVVSHMFPRDAWMFAGINLYVIKGMLGFNTGYALRCDASGCRQLPGTDAAFPNGVQVDPQGTTLFLNSYLGGEVRKIALADGSLQGSAAIVAPDNSQWDAAGRLLVASHTASMLEMRDCFGIRTGACSAEFAIVELDPETMKTRTLLQHSGAPMGAATVAQQAGDALYLGSFVGDRILRAPMPR